MIDNNIEIRDLQVSYENLNIIENLNLKIPKGKISIIIGSNGSGKSTLLKTIARIIKVKKGDILINGKNIKEKSNIEIAREMAVLTQNPIIPKDLLVRNLVAYGRFPYQSKMGGLKQEDYDIINWAMEETNVLEFSDRPLKTLSGGQLQRVFIAMAIAQKTDILLLDEPTTYLDISHQLEIFNLLKKINKENNTTIVMVIHELNNASKFADNLIGLKKGSIVFEGSPKEVFNSKNLEILYNINPEIQMSKNNQYPICVDFELI